MKRPFPIGVVAPSSIVPQVEFQIALERLRASGVEPVVHPAVKKRDFVFAGSTEERARAFFDYAHDSRFDVIWSARGGYGANHLLPYLDRWTAEEGKPRRKLLVGYSDVTVLHAFVADRWGWDCLHAPMPASKSFLLMKKPDWKCALEWVQRRAQTATWQGKRLKFIGAKPKTDVDGLLVGGNLAVWNSLLGTPYAPVYEPEGGRGKILFLEDIAESVSRIDRMIQQLEQARGFRNVRAIVLGDFLDCGDSSPMFLAKAPKPARVEGALKNPKPAELKPLRAKFAQAKAFQEIFGALGDRLGIPVAVGLPAGHGPNYTPLPLQADYKLSASGKFELLSWSWLS
ncbi:MAG: LD-carboxypeptidase [Bacteriovoracia bacterium]